MMQSAFLCVTLDVEHKKNTISWGFNLVFKSHFLRKSRIARPSSKIEFFNYFAKTSHLGTLFKEK